MDAQERLEVGHAAERWFSFYFGQMGLDVVRFRDIDPHLASWDDARHGDCGLRAGTDYVAWFDIKTNLDCSVDSPNWVVNRSSLDAFPKERHYYAYVRTVFMARDVVAYCDQTVYRSEDVLDWCRRHEGHEFYDRGDYFVVPRLRGPQVEVEGPGAIADWMRDILLVSATPAPKAWIL